MQNRIRPVIAVAAVLCSAQVCDPTPPTLEEAVDAYNQNACQFGLGLQTPVDDTVPQNFPGMISRGCSPTVFCDNVTPTGPFGCVSVFQTAAARAEYEAAATLCFGDLFNDVGNFANFALSAGAAPDFDELEQLGDINYLISVCGYDPPDPDGGADGGPDADDGGAGAGGFDGGVAGAGSGGLAGTGGYDGGAGAGAGGFAGSGGEDASTD